MLLRKRNLGIRWKQFKAGRDKAMELRTGDLTEAETALVAAGKLVDHFNGTDVKKFHDAACELMGHGYTQFGNEIRDQQNQVNKEKLKPRDQAHSDELNKRLLGWERAESIAEAIAMARSFTGPSSEISMLHLPPIVIPEVE